MICTNAININFVNVNLFFIEINIHKNVFLYSINLYAFNIPKKISLSK